MTYSGNYSARNTIFDSGDTVEGDHIKSIYDEMGSDPSGASADLTARLNAIEASVSAEFVRDTIAAALSGTGNVTVTADDSANTITITTSGQSAEEVRDTIGTALVAGSGIAIDVDDTGNTITVSLSGTSGGGGGGGGGTVQDPPGPTVPEGFTRTALWEFADGSTDLADNFNLVHNAVQSGTNSYSTSTNVYQSGGQLHLRAENATTSSQPYGSAYISSKAASYFPLEGRMEAMVRYPMAHSTWPCFWIDAGGSAGRFEIDAAEMFCAQTPGKTSVVMHCPNSYQTNLRVYSGVTSNHWSGSSGWDWMDPTAGNADWDGPLLGSTVYGAAVDWHDPADWANTPWVRVAVEVSKIVSGGNYTIQIDVYWAAESTGWGDVHIVRYTDPFDAVTGSGPLLGVARGSAGDYDGTKPPWVQETLDAGFTEDAFWDVRFDNWVGGSGTGSCWKSSARIYDYDGTLGNTTTAGFADNGTVPNASLDRWPLVMDVAWVQHCETGEVTPPGATVLAGDWNVAVSGTDGALVSTTNTSFNAVYRNNAGTAYNSTIDTELLPDGVSNTVIHLLAATANHDVSEVHWNPTGTVAYTSAYTRFFFRTADVTPAGNTIICYFADATPTTFHRVYLMTDGTIRARFNGGSSEGTTQLTTAGALANDTWYAIEVGYDQTAQTHGIRVTNADTNTWIETLSGSLSSVSPTQQTGKISWGIVDPNYSTLGGYQVHTAGHAVNYGVSKSYVGVYSDTVYS